MWGGICGAVDADNYGELKLQPETILDDLAKKADACTTFPLFKSIQT